MKNMDLKSLLIFDALLQLRSVTKVAERMKMTQSAVSHGLARLRRDFADPLFVPTRSGMTPTSRAREVEPLVRQAINSILVALAPSPPFEPKSYEGMARIAINDFVSMNLVPPLIETMRQSAPRFQLQFVALDAASDWARLESGEIGLAIASFRDLPSNLHSRPLFKGQHVVMARRDHPLIGRRLTLQRYLSLEHVTVSPYVSMGIDRELEAHGLRRYIAVSMPSLLLVPEVIAASDYVVTLGERVARTLIRGYPLEIHRLPVPVRNFTVAMVWHARHHQDPAYRWLREQLVRLSTRIEPVAGEIVVRREDRQGVNGESPRR